MQSFTGKEYLKIDLANHFGMDKEDWDVRLNWVNQNEEVLGAMVSQAEEPTLFYAALQAYRSKDTAIGYPISLDATASGLQLLACLTRDKEAAKLCNVVNVGKRMDAYTAVFGYMQDYLGTTSTVARKACKLAVMASLYGSTQEPEKAFSPEALPVFYQVMTEKTPLVWELNEALKEMWDSNALSHSWVLPDGFEVVIPVMGIKKETVIFGGKSIEVTYKENMPKKRGRSLCANLVHSVDGMVVREIVRRCSMNKDGFTTLVQALELNKKYGKSTPRIIEDGDELFLSLWNNYLVTGYLSSRILEVATARNVQYVDPEPILELIGSLPKESFAVMPTHDCFRIHPNYGDSLRREYNYQLAMITRSRMLDSILSQMLNQEIKLDLGDLDWKDVLETEYALS